MSDQLSAAKRLLLIYEALSRAQARMPHHQGGHNEHQEQTGVSIVLVGNKSPDCYARYMENSSKRGVDEFFLLARGEAVNVAYHAAETFCSINAEFYIADVEDYADLGNALRSQVVTVAQRSCSLTGRPKSGSEKGFTNPIVSHLSL